MKNKEFNSINFKVDDIDKIEGFKGGLMENCIRSFASNIDNMMFEFLNEQGYKIEKPYTAEKAMKIKEQLDKDNKYVDYIEIMELEKERIITHYIPYIFNKNRPLQPEEIEIIKQKYIKLKGIKNVI